MTSVEFEFELNEKVTSVLGEQAIIRGFFFDDGGKQYLIAVKSGRDKWVPQRELTHGWK